ncbi:hypothetical protein PNOK_0086100 [Pyrrhoderma noxium]|uniref:Nascent polypeptide-associated complex subunit alpha-like UBA domain-containing protein n=1 Tax=Pyrrhoderma noxium TaxID=2282107 RepID=A0A286UW12_9AGAM|nr:hypothetical protein PNOK_0086100 [Pyrrhoderma noxium]
MQRNTNGRPEPEVIVNFVDGLSYSKGKLEAALLAGGIFENSAPKSKETHNVKKEDVELIIRELEIPRIQAERALSNNNGNLEQALATLITPINN